MQIDTIGALVLYSLSLGAWSRWCILSMQPGLWRLVSMLPFVGLMFQVVSMAWPEHQIMDASRAHQQEVLAYMLAYLFSGLNVAKALALCMNRGPLAVLGQGPVLQFFAVAMLPVVPCAGLGEQSIGGSPATASNTRAHLSSIVTKGTVVETACWALIKGCSAWLCGTLVRLHPGLLPGWLEVVRANWAIQDILMVSATACILGWIMDASCALCAVLVALPTLNAFNSPLRSRSVGELWRSRWNVLVSHTLRWLLYDPLVEGRLIATSVMPAPEQFSKQSSQEVGGLSRQESLSNGQPSAGPASQIGLAAQQLAAGGSEKGQKGAGVGVGQRSARKMQAAKMAQQEHQKREQMPRRLVGVAATFLICGLLHELAYWLANGRLTPRLRWLQFFSLQGLAILLERAWYQAMGSLGGVVTTFLQDSGIDRQNPAFVQSARAFFDNWVAWGFSLIFMSVCLHWLWLPPCRLSPASCFIP